MELTSGKYSSLFQSLSGDVKDELVEAVTLAILSGFWILVVGSALANVTSSVSVSLPSAYLQFSRVFSCGLRSSARSSMYKGQQDIDSTC